MLKALRHCLTVAVLVVGLGTTTSSSAFASSSHASTSAWTTWHAEWVTYIQSLKATNATFRSAVSTDRATYASAVAAATTKAQRQAARTALTTSLAAALSARVSGLTADGTPPAPPAGYNGTAYVTSLQNINMTFRSALSAAETTLAAALTSATSASARLSAREAYNVSVDNALVTRSTALLALGAPPTKPGQPTS